MAVLSAVSMYHRSKELTFAAIFSEADMMIKDFTTVRIIFMGTPEFAVASLDALVKAGCDIIAVVTAPDKPGGRGMQLQQSAVKKYATEHNLRVLQPEKLKDPVFIAELISLHADLQIVVAFRMLPEMVWNMPPMGTINVHGSLLPQYRGAAPINWAVINGEKETGVTTFKLKHEIDTGDILLQERFTIGENETAGEVHDRMKEIGAALLVTTVRGVADGSLRELPQEEIVNGQWAMGNRQSSMLNSEMSMGEPAATETHSPFTTHHSLLKHAPKIFTDTCKIDFNKTVSEVHNLIRGLSPFPGAFTFLNGKMMKVYKSEPQGRAALSQLDPGKAAASIIQATGSTTTVHSDGKTFLKFACADGFILVKELQLEGKKRMSVEDFLRGYKFQ